MPVRIGTVVSLLACSLLGAAAPGDPVWGVSGGLALGSQTHLRTTTGSKPGLELGVLATWKVGQGGALRASLDLTLFGKGTDDAPVAGLQQDIETEVRATVLGVTYLRRAGAWRLGGGAHLVRWTVDNTNRLAAAGGSVALTSSPAWTRGGLSLVASRPLNERWALEGRLLASTYGYEDAAAQMLTVRVIRTF